MKNGLAVFVVVGSLTASCGSAENAESPSTVAVSGPAEDDATGDAPTFGDQSVAPGFDAFCVEFDALGGERPEAYVGSPEHLADIERLLALADGDAATDLAIFRDYLASGAIDVNDPETSDTANWPDEVLVAVDRVQGFGAENC